MVVGLTVSRWATGDHVRPPVPARARCPLGASRAVGPATPKPLLRSTHARRSPASAEGKKRRNCRAHGHVLSTLLPSFPDVGALTGLLVAALTATFKIGLVCWAVPALMARDILPKETPSVMSKAAYTLFIPCTLAANLVRIMSQPATRSTALLSVPCMAALQVAVGLAMGRVAAKVVQGFQHGSLSSLDPSKGSAAARAIAASTAAAIGVPSAAPGLLSRRETHPPGTPELVQLASGFGNSLTLPLVFLASLLTGDMYESAVSYTALFLAGWSPLLWTYAASVLAPLEGQDCSLEGRFRKWGGSLSPLAGLTRPSDTRREGGGAASASLDVAVIEPDTPGAGDAPGAGAGRLQRTVEVQLVTRDAGKGEASSGAVSGSEGRGEGVGLRNGYRQTLAAGDGEAGPGPGGSRSGSLAPARWTGRVAEAVGGVMNPPLWGILAGTLVGLSPLGPALVGPASALQGLPWEARGALHVLRAVFDVVAMLGAATLPVQAVVLAASLAQPGGSTGVTRARIMPSEPSERRAMVAIGIVRAFLVPMAGLGIYFLGRRWLPKDPVCHLAILLQAAMPSAQNLVLLMQLKPSTQPLARRLAQLLLRLYPLSALPVAAWVALFCATVGVTL